MKSGSADTDRATPSVRVAVLKPVNVTDRTDKSVTAMPTKPISWSGAQGSSTAIGWISRAAPG